MDEWYKAAYYDPATGTYFNFPTGSDTAPTPVPSGTDADTAVYLQRGPGSGPAEVTLAGGLSPFGTMGQGGNVWEWEETEYDLVNDDGSSDRGARAGSWSWDFDSLWSSSRLPDYVTDEGANQGFRVASLSTVPEPSSLVLCLTGLAVLGWRRWRRGRK